MVYVGTRSVRFWPKALALLPELQLRSGHAGAGESGFACGNRTENGKGVPCQLDSNGYHRYGFLVPQETSELMRGCTSYRGISMPCPAAPRRTPQWLGSLGTGLPLHSLDTKEHW